MVWTLKIFSRKVKDYYLLLFLIKLINLTGKGVFKWVNGVKYDGDF